MSSEKELYPKVEKFLVDAFGCLSTKINMGTKYGHIDILGLRERRSDFASQTELVAVEVKRGGSGFLSFIGQTIGYSLYAHRVYLAWEKNNGESFTFEEIDIASKFGVGLLSISKEGEITRITSSAEFAPENYHLLQVIRKLGYFECTICRSYYPEEFFVRINKRGLINMEEEPSYRGKLNKAIVERKPALYWLYHLAEIREDERKNIGDKRFICKDCCSIFSSILPDES